MERPPCTNVDPEEELVNSQKENVENKNNRKSRSGQKQPTTPRTRNTPYTPLQRAGGLESQEGCLRKRSHKESTRGSERVMPRQAEGGGTKGQKAKCPSVDLYYKKESVTRDEKRIKEMLGWASLRSPITNQCGGLSHRQVTPGKGVYRERWGQNKRGAWQASGYSAEKHWKQVRRLKGGGK